MNHSLYRMAVETRILIGLIAKLTGRDLEQHLAEKGHAISGLQYGVLRMLSGESLTLSTLSHKMMLSPATLVPAVDHLERGGLVRRERDPRDRRRTPLHITEDGTKLLQTFMERPLLDSLYHSLEQMNEADCGQLLSLLRRLIAGMPEGAEIAARVMEHVHAHLSPPQEQSPPSEN